MTAAASEPSLADASLADPSQTDPDPASVADADPTPTGGPAHRLRDLDRGGRLVAVAVGLLLLVPVAASVVRALDMGWRPSNDDALIVLRAFDVFSDDPPLVGQPSTTHLYGDGVPSRHPGPIEFYLLAGPVRLLGPIVGTLLTAAAFAAASVLVTSWVAFRRAGAAVGLGAAVLVALSMWSQGTAVLSDPISSNVGGLPLMAGTALAWALWCDDRRLWPLAAAVWSFTIQQHLAVFGIAGLVAGWGVLGAVVTTVAARREPGRVRSALRWGGLALAVAVVCWIPPLVDQVAGTGNLGRILGFSGEDRETLGLRPALDAAGRAIGVPPLLLHRSTSGEVLGGWVLTAPLDGLDRVGIVIGVGLFAVAAATAVLAWRRRPGSTEARARVALAATGLVLLVGGIVTVANIPAGIESARINFYRWTWVAAIVAWGSVLWAVGVLIGRWTSRAPARLRSLAPVGVLVVLALVVTSTATADRHGDARRDESLFPFEEEAVAGMLDAVPDDGRPVRLEVVGGASILAVGPAMAVALEEAGHEVRVDAAHEAGYDESRVAPRSDDETVVWVRSSPDPLVDDPAFGQRVATIDLEDELSWTDRYIEVRVDADEGG